MSAIRTALVTGASKGIGRSLSVALVRAGVEVYGTGRDAESLKETERICGEFGTFHARLLEVRDAAEVARVVAEPAQLDLCINNAGIARIRPFLETPPEEIEEIIGVNVIGAFFVMQAAAARMSQQGSGRIVTIASDGAVKSLPKMAPYCASKHAVAGLSKTLADELGDTGVQVTTVYPGGVRTTILTDNPGDYGMDPDELAQTIVDALLAAGTTVRITELHLQPWRAVP